MKTAAYSLLALFGLSLFHFGQFTIAPSDMQAAAAWNLGLIFAPVLALVFQWKIAKERHIPIAIFLSAWAVVNAALVLGSRAGALTAHDWQLLLTGAGLPVLPGKTVLGGVLLAIVVFVALRRWWGISFHVADALVIGLPLAGITARLGCLYAGCCFGVPTGAAHGICYGPGTPAFTQQLNAGLLTADAGSSLPVYPIQAILIIGNLLIFSLLWHGRKTITRPGALGFLGLALLTLQRFGIEFFRDIATNRGQFGQMWAGLKMAQWACLLMAAIGVAGFLWVQFGKNRADNRRASASINQQAMAIGGIALGVLLLQGVLTLDESMMILVSCLPAIVVLGRLLWRAHLSGEKVGATGLMLSGIALGLLSSPFDSLSPTPVANRQWNETGVLANPNNSRRQWMEISGGAAYGSYDRVTRDCGGNVIDRDKIGYRAGGLELSSNWQNNDLLYSAGLRGAFGSAEPEDNLVLPLDDYRYSSFGLYGKFSSKWIGVSLGGFNRLQKFRSSETESRFLASGSLRVGSLRKYAFDIRFFEEPAFALSNEPYFSIGLLNWGFNDPSGASFLRMGIAGTNDGEAAFHLSGGFPIGNAGLSGTLATYFGNANMVHVGLRYRFRDGAIR